MVFYGTLPFSIEGVALLGIEEAERGCEEKDGGVKEETTDNDKQLVIYQDSINLTPAESVLATPSVVDYRSASYNYSCYCGFNLFCKMLKCQFSFVLLIFFLDPWLLFHL